MFYYNLFPLLLSTSLVRLLSTLCLPLSYRAHRYGDVGRVSSRYVGDVHHGYRVRPSLLRIDGQSTDTRCTHIPSHILTSSSPHILPPTHISSHPHTPSPSHPHTPSPSHHHPHTHPHPHTFWHHLMYLLTCPSFIHLPSTTSTTTHLDLFWHASNTTDLPYDQAPLLLIKLEISWRSWVDIRNRWIPSEPYYKINKAPLVRKQNTSRPNPNLIWPNWLWSL